MILNWHLLFVDFLGDYFSSHGILQNVCITTRSSWEWDFESVVVLFIRWDKEVNQKLQLRLSPRFDRNLEVES